MARPEADGQFRWLPSTGITPSRTPPSRRETPARRSPLGAPPSPRFVRCLRVRYTVVRHSSPAPIAPRLPIRARAPATSAAVRLRAHLPHQRPLIARRKTLRQTAVHLHPQITAPAPVRRRPIPLGAIPAEVAHLIPAAAVAEAEAADRIPAAAVAAEAEGATPAAAVAAEAATPAAATAANATAWHFSSQLTTDLGAPRRRAFKTRNLLISE